MFIYVFCFADSCIYAYIFIVDLTRKYGNLNMKSPIDIEGIYEEYIVKESDTNRAQIKSMLGKSRGHYRVSSAGMCFRKLYYESVLKLEPSSEINSKTRRIFRLGEIVHQDIQNALVEHCKRKEPKENI
tara:strand:+ start:340 stop:726 length:387 start_codon:yes stop_codon:yes gene_type:complete